MDVTAQGAMSRRMGEVEGPSARERILEAASELFYREGIRAAGVDTIIERSGVAKATLYSHFRSKDALIAAVLERRGVQWRAWLAGEVARRAKRPEERLPAVFDALGDRFAEADFRGCAFLNAAVEIVDPEHPAREVVRGHKRLVHEYVCGLARDAGVKECEALAREVGLLIDGAMIGALSASECPAAAAKSAAEALLRRARGG